MNELTQSQASEASGGYTAWGAIMCSVGSLGGAIGFAAASSAGGAIGAAIALFGNAAVCASGQPGTTSGSTWADGGWGYAYGA